MFLLITEVLKIYEPSELAWNIFFIIFIICFPAFVIVPGLFDENFKGAFHGATYDQLKYSLFLGLTLGVGPIYIFFRDYDKQLNSCFQRNTMGT